MELKNSLLTASEKELYATLYSLREKLDAMTLEQYNRINPFFENLCNWNKKGDQFVSEGSVIYDSATLIGSIEFGKHVWIGPYCSIDGSGGLIIGSHCVFAAGVQVFTHDTAKWALSGGLAKYEHSPVKIGSCVFVGTHSIILRGVTIGDHVLVAANTTVTSDVPANSIIAGSPARIIGSVHINGDSVHYEYLHDCN